MNILVLAALTEATGNCVTAQRIAQHLAASHDVTLVDATQVSTASLRAIVERARIDRAIGVHALLAGPFLSKLDLSYALIFGGTDLYEHSHPLHFAQMTRAVASASHLVAFSDENRARAEWLWPGIKGRIELVPQAVDTTRDDRWSLRASLGLARSDLVALLPTGIRRVKDPLHVVDAMAVWHVVHPRVHLVVAGALLEGDFAEDAVRTMSERAGIHFVGPLPRSRMLSAIREADCVLNTSLSEGMCGALLEAMALGTPVVARRNAGNESLVTHGHSGLLYDSPSELVHWVSALGASPELRARLARAAQRKIDAQHAPAVEREAYERIIRSLRARAEGSAQLDPHARAPSESDAIDAVLPAARELSLSDESVAAVEAMVQRIRRDADLSHSFHQLSGLLATAPPAVAIREIARSSLDLVLEREGARAFYLALALAQVPAMRARHEKRALPPEITAETAEDLALWAEHQRRLSGSAGVSLEILAWAQRYLRGELLRFGALQFDLRPFEGSVRAFRRRADRSLVLLSLDGRRIDARTGVVTDERPTLDETFTREHELVLEPGSPVLEMWIVVNALVNLESIGRGIRQAYATFARLAPETTPVAVCGESWRLDPLVAPLLPPELGIMDMQRVCSLYPSTLPEAKTIRRLFGPDVDRGKLASLDRSTMDVLQRSIAALLDDPTVQLRARCGFALRDAIESLPQWSAP